MNEAIRGIVELSAAPQALTVGAVKLRLEGFGFPNMREETIMRRAGVLGLQERIVWPVEKGTVTWFDGGKGWGLIQRDDCQGDAGNVFVHGREVQGGTLTPGEHVSFQIKAAERSPVAVAVHRIGRAAAEGMPGVAGHERTADAGHRASLARQFTHLETAVTHAQGVIYLLAAALRAKLEEMEHEHDVAAATGICLLADAAADSLGSEFEGMSQVFRECPKS